MRNGREERSVPPEAQVSTMTLQEANARAAELGMPPLSEEEFEALSSMNGIIWNSDDPGDGDIQMTSTLKTVFSNRPRLLMPVVHCLNRAQTERETEIAFANGAAGVFLISHRTMPLRHVAQAAEAMLRASLFVGINPYGISNAAGIELVTTHRLPAVWLDDAGVREGQDLQTKEYLAEAQEELIRARSAEEPIAVIYFGGVAFKYTPPISDAWVGRAAVLAAEGGVDVITTSGPATGEPPTIEKIQRMHDALAAAGLLEAHPLAIASGITAANAQQFLPYVSVFLVATGIERDFGAFDPVRVRELADIIHGG